MLGEGIITELTVEKPDNKQAGFCYLESLILLITLHAKIGLPAITPGLDQLLF